MRRTGSDATSAAGATGGTGARERLGNGLFTRVAGPDGPRNRARIHGTPGPRWFGPERPVRRVHGDASMFIGGLSALLLQSLHPLAMAAVAAHSGFRGDPWGRLQRTSTFLATTTYGTAAHAQQACDRVRAVHERVRGVTDLGEEYRASDPRLLGWVHVAEVDSFLRAHQRYGARPLTEEECDGYVADMARVAVALGVPDPPRSGGELAERVTAYRPELRATAQARDTARFLLLSPPVPLVVRLPYGVLAANAVSLLPGWAARELRLPRLPVVDDLCVRPLGHAMTATLRWAMAPARRAVPAPPG
ncbi:oxygenase MpaB family protein [Streptomyces sp. NPDC002328]|uniref:oxygenase MpaB family protein n=1 Tax=Streptomyces sp. NPDC002328 TaxID=3364642 RepID=UPI003687695F